MVVDCGWQHSVAVVEEDDEEEDGRGQECQLEACSDLNMISGALRDDLV